MLRWIPDSSWQTIFNVRDSRQQQHALMQVSRDAALVAGKHIEMGDHVQACVDRRIPYLLDKPFADCADRLRPCR